MSILLLGQSRVLVSAGYHGNVLCGCVEAIMGFCNTLFCSVKDDVIY